MDKALTRALADLQKQNAKGLPNTAAVESAPKATSWKGHTADGRTWSLCKNAAESYNASY